MIRVRFHFLLAVVGASWVTVLYRPNAVTIVLAVIFSLSVLTLRDFRRICLLFLLALILIGYSLIGYRSLSMEEGQIAQQKNVKLLVFPDQLQVSEHGFVRGQGQDERGQRFLLAYQAKNQEDVDRFTSISFPTKMSGPVKQVPILGATNDYQFDFHQFWKTQRVTQQTTFQSVTLARAHAQNPLQAFFFFSHRLHATAGRWANQLPNPLGDYAGALLLGMKGTMLYENNPKIAELGLIHLFALSGLHVSFLAKQFRQLARRLRITREVADGLLAVLLVMFYFFTGSLAVLFRALVAGELRIVNRNFSCQWHPVTIWSWSLLASLVFYPQILLTLGGQLSFALTLAIILTARYNYWLRGFFLSAVSFPIILAQQFAWNIWQTMANILVVPLFSVIVLPATLIGYFGAWLSVVKESTNVVINLFDRFVYWFGQLPGYVVIGAFSWPVLLFLFILPWLFFRVKWQLKSFFSLCWCALFILNYAWIHWPKEGEWTTFDIGQGDAAVLIEPKHRSVMMIDTGGKVTFGSHPVYQTANRIETRPRVLEQKKLKEQEGLAQSVIIPYLHARGIAHIDTISLSHQDQDHIGDTRVLLENFRVDRVVMPAGMAELPAYQRKIKPYLKNTKVVEATDRTKLTNCPLTIRYPFDSGLAGNDDSLAWTGRIGGTEIYTAGDLDRSGEQKILDKYPFLAPKIVKFGHHGSRTATDPNVFDVWQPRIGIVSAGRDSRYGHPHQEVLDVANHERMIVYSTQVQGMLRYVYQKNQGHFEVSRHDITKSKGTN